MPEHGVALTVVHEAPFVMCECGWHVALPQVTTFDHVAQLVKEHRDA